MLDADAKWASVSLRFFGDDLPIDEIGQRLDLEPKRLGRKGEPVGKRPKSAAHKTNLWMWWLSVDSSIRLEQQLEMALEILEPRQERILEVARQSGVRGELFVGFSSGNGQGGAFFAVSLLERLARLGLPLHFDLYPPDVDEAER